MAVLIFKAQFHDDGDAATGLTVTVNVHRITLASGAYSQVVTAGSATEMADGLYFYRYADADLSLYDYSASFNTAGTADQTAVGVQGLVVPDALVSSRLAPTDAGRTLDIAATGEASANVTKQAGVAVAAADADGMIKVNAEKWTGLFLDEFAPPVTAYMDSGNTITSQRIRDAMKLAPTAGDPAAGSVDAHLDAVALEATAQAILEDTGTTLPALIAACASVVANSTDATAAGAITRKRGNSWSIALTLGSIVGYTSLWFSVKRSYDDADSASLFQIKLNSPSASDGLLYVNGAAASNALLGSITVSDATTGAIIVAVDETITDDLSPGTYYYDAQALITGAVTTPDSGTFTITADVTRSVT